jgi:HK97 family phage major capsid protein
MPDVTAGASIAFGNFQLAYVIVDKAGIRFLRDPFTDKRNLLFTPIAVAAVRWPFGSD